MNVTVENLAPCKKLLRVDVDAQKVDEIFEKVTKEFLGQARVPGFRPGKVPRETILKLYGKQIEGQAKDEIVKWSFQQAIKEKNLRVVHFSKIEEVQFGKGQNMEYTTTLEVAPEFELPEYKGITVKVPAAVVTVTDEENAMKALQAQKSTFEDPNRPSEKDDYLIVNYTAPAKANRSRTLCPRPKAWIPNRNSGFRSEPMPFCPVSESSSSEFLRAIAERLISTCQPIRGKRHWQGKSCNSMSKC